MKKHLLLILLLVLILASCKTRQERAVKLFDKAVALHPDLLGTIGTRVVIDTLFLYKDTLFIPADTTVFAIKLDSLRKEGKILLFENDKLKVEIERVKVVDDKGVVSYREKGIVTNKEKLIYRDVEVPVYITKTIPARIINKPYEVIKIVKQKDIFWWTGLIVLVGAVGFASFKLYMKWRTVLPL